MVTTYLVLTLVSWVDPFVSPLLEPWRGLRWTRTCPLSLNLQWVQFFKCHRPNSGWLLLPVRPLLLASQTLSMRSRWKKTTQQPFPRWRERVSGNILCGLSSPLVWMFLRNIKKPGVWILGWVLYLPHVCLPLKNLVAFSKIVYTPHMCVFFYSVHMYLCLGHAEQCIFLSPACLWKIIFRIFHILS